MPSSEVSVHEISVLSSNGPENILMPLELSQYLVKSSAMFLCLVCLEAARLLHLLQMMKWDGGIGSADRGCISTTWHPVLNLLVPASQCADRAGALVWKRRLGTTAIASYGTCGWRDLNKFFFYLILLFTNEILPAALPLCDQNRKLTEVWGECGNYDRSTCVRPGEDLL